VGRRPGIYMDRDAAKSEIEGILCADMTVCTSYQDAEAYLNQFGLQFNPPTTSTLGFCSWLANVIVNHPKLNDAMIAFCDGSLPDNGVRTDGKIACVFPFSSNLNVDKFDVRATTNNQAEFVAGIAALERANAVNQDRQTPLFIFTASKLLVDSMTEKVDTWSHNGWKTSKGSAVKNQDLLESLISLSDQRTVKWHYVPKEEAKKSWAGHWSRLTEAKARLRSGSAASA
jgi:ribonuclease HI